MALSKKQKAEKAQKQLDEARALLAQAEQNARENGVEVESVEAPAIAGTDNKKGSQTVFVACKLPRGLMLQLFEEMEIPAKQLNGEIKMVKQYGRVGETVRLKGYAVPFGAIPNYPIIGDFGITEVRREFWEKWLAQNQKLDLVQKNLVYALDSEVDARAWSKEHAELKCGLEPMNPKGDVRAESPKSPNLSDIETDSERDAIKAVA